MHKSLYASTLALLALLVFLLTGCGGGSKMVSDEAQAAIEEAWVAIPAAYAEDQPYPSAAINKVLAVVADEKRYSLVDGPGTSVTRSLDLTLLNLSKMLKSGGEGTAPHFSRRVKL